LISLDLSSFDTAILGKPTNARSTISTQTQATSSQAAKSCAGPDAYPNASADPITAIDECNQCTTCHFGRSGETQEDSQATQEGEYCAKNQIQQLIDIEDLSLCGPVCFRVTGPGEYPRRRVRAMGFPYTFSEG
jgi:hypothetical protein